MLSRELISLTKDAGKTGSIQSEKGGKIFSYVGVDGGSGDWVGVMVVPEVAGSVPGLCDD